MPGELGWHRSGEAEVVHFCKRPAPRQPREAENQFLGRSSLRMAAAISSEKNASTFSSISANHPSGSMAGAHVGRAAPSSCSEHILQSPLSADVLELVLFLLFIIVKQASHNLLYSRLPVFILFAVQLAGTRRTRMNRIPLV